MGQLACIVCEMSMSILYAGLELGGSDFVQTLLQHWFFHFLYIIIMAAPVKTPKDEMETRLLALFQNAGVPNDQLDRLADLGVKSVALFTNIVDTKAELRPFLMKALGLNHNDADPLTAIAAQMAQARIISVYAAAKSTDEVEIKRSAERAASHEAPVVELQELMQQKQAYESRKRALPLVRTPSKAYYERRVGEVSTYFEAEQLTEVTNRAQELKFMKSPSAQSNGQINWDPGAGAFRTKVTSFGVLMPKDAESLRARIKLIGIAFEFIKMKFSSTRVLQSASVELFDQYYEYLEGEDCWGLATLGEGNLPVSTPTIQNVFIYDQAIRTKLALAMNNGVDAETALLRLISPVDPQSVALKQINFLNNVAIGVNAPEARRMTAPGIREAYLLPPDSQKRKLEALDNGGESGGLSKAAKKRQTAKLAAEKKALMAIKDKPTPPPQVPPGQGQSKNALKKAAKRGRLALTNGGVGDGGGAGATAGADDRGKRTSSPRKRMICWNYNKGTCTRKDCKFAHACSKCGKDGHTISQCKSGSA